MTLIEDNIFIVGGKDSLARLNDVYALDIPSLTWSKIEVRDAHHDIFRVHPDDGPLDCPC